MKIPKQNKNLRRLLNEERKRRHLERWCIQERMEKRKWFVAVAKDIANWKNLPVYKVQEDGTIIKYKNYQDSIDLIDGIGYLSVKAALDDMTGE